VGAEVRDHRRGVLLRLDAPVRRLAMADVRHALRRSMEAAVSIDAARIKVEARALLDA